MSKCPLLHIIVVGFHHKKGCQVEYSYPPLVEGTSEDSGEVPSAWKYLPTLALPDGAHNYTKDTVYFHLINKDDKTDKSTVYGVSCYRQLDADELINKTDDITRGTVQKSICILTSQPYYGVIGTKLEMITHAWFEQKDFTKVSLLKDAYESLQASLSSIDIKSQIMMGIRVHDVVKLYRHKILTLFKLIMLERRVVVFMTPVGDLCNVILSLLSLLPGLLEHGLVESVQNSSYPQISPNLKEKRISTSSDSFIEISYSDNQKPADTASESTNSNKTADTASESTNSNKASDTASESTNSNKSQTAPQPDKQRSEVKTRSEVQMRSEIHMRSEPHAEEALYDSEEEELLQSKRMALVLDADTEGEGESQEEVWSDTPLLQNTSDTNTITQLEIVPVVSPTTINIDKNGLPLAIFTKGSVCHPYLSLSYYDILEDINIRSFIIGASNVLFKSKKRNIDVLVEDGAELIEIQDKSLQKQLQLTTEDLRFTDMLLSRVDETVAQGEFLEHTEWEGGDEWIRAQFRDYLTSLLATVLADDETLLQAFNPHFVRAWKTTHNYKIWRNTLQQLDDMIPGHPCSGSATLSDVRLQLARSERGRKINAVVTQAGKAVQDTTKVVGGALNNAKSLVANWWSGSKDSNSTNQT